MAGSVVFKVTVISVYKSNLQQRFISVLYSFCKDRFNSNILPFSKYVCVHVLTDLPACFSEKFELYVR